MRVGFIGLGAMGPAMATRLIDAGHEVHVWKFGHPNRAKSWSSAAATACKAWKAPLLATRSSHACG